MEIIPYRIESKEVWDSFCMNHQGSWFWHTTTWMEYTMNSSLSALKENLSFFVKKKDIVLAIVPLIKEENDSVVTLSYNGGPLPAPLIRSGLSEKANKAVEAIVFENIRILGMDRQALRIQMRLSNANISGISDAEAGYMKFNYYEIPSHTSVLDISRSFEAIYSGIHVKHKQSIKQARKMEPTVRIYDEKTITSNIMEAFKEAYLKAAGKITRPQKTFDLLFDMVSSKRGILLELSCDTEVYSYIYIIIFKHYAYYSMACSDAESPIGSHILHLEAIRYLKDLGFTHYELGEQFYGPSPFYEVTDKLVTISKFKKRFGGSLVSQPIGEYVFNKSKIASIWNQRVDSYISKIDTQEA
jgi:hypothetical protein